MVLFNAPNDELKRFGLNTKNGPEGKSKNELLLLGGKIGNIDYFYGVKKELFGGCKYPVARGYSCH